ncbi:MAG: cation-translocating P-type ATPase [Candidatus Aquicultorales bacterium]
MHRVARLRKSELFEELATSPRGLTPEEASARLEKYGLNEIQKVKGTPLIYKFLGNLIHLFAVLFWIAAALSFLADAPQLGIAIIAVIFINAIFSFWQEYKAEQAIEALMKLLPKKATVLRAGEVVEIATSELVPGDLMLLSEGDSISADGRIIQEFEMRTNNSTLTGESEPARRTAEPVVDETLLPGEIPNLAFAGTSVAYGNGRALVYATGMATEFGKIANLAQTIGLEKTPLYIEMDRISRIIAVIAIGLGIVFFALGYLVGGLTFGPAFVFAIGIIIANVPEGLLPTLTLSLALGVQRMAKRHALIKELPAVETFGRTNVICTDKTGTLTQNEMTVRALWIDGHEFEVTGAGYDPRNGKVEADPSIVSPGLLWVLAKAASYPNNAQLVPPEGASGKWGIRGDPTEGALLVAAQKTGFDYADAVRVEPRVYELPFDSVRKRMSTIHEIEGTRIAYVKGAPLETLALCTRVLTLEGERPLTKEIREGVIAINDSFARSALRVLSMAYRNLPAGFSEYDIEHVEKDLVLVGLMAMMDPPRPEVQAAVKESKEAGIKTIMITGDYGLTAESIAKKIGIVEDAHARIVVGSEVHEMNDDELKKVVQEEGVLFARVSPEHKMRIVIALKSCGQTVAVTGDGVNDAPALKRADVGVAMGITGTDVAKESAKVVITDDNFATIVSAVEEGRGIYDNIQRFITYIFTHLVPEIVPFILFALFNVPLAITVLQIIAIDLGTEIIPSLALGSESPEPGTMKRSPRKNTDRLLNLSVLGRAYLWLGMIEAILANGAFFVFLYYNGWSWSELPELNRMLTQGSASEDIVMLYRQATTITFGAIVALQIGNGFALRAIRESTFRIGLFTNRFYLLGIGVAVSIFLLLVYIPPFASIFDLAPVPLGYLLALLAFAPIIFFLEEGRKMLVRKRLHDQGA